MLRDDPEFIRALRERLTDAEPVPVPERLVCIASDIMHINVADIDNANIYGLDAANDQAVCQALKNNDLSWAEETALDLSAEGCDAILVSLDSAGGGWACLLTWLTGCSGM